MILSKVDVFLDVQVTDNDVILAQLFYAGAKGMQMFSAPVTIQITDPNGKLVVNGQMTAPGAYMKYANTQSYRPQDIPFVRGTYHVTIRYAGTSRYTPAVDSVTFAI